MTFEIERKFLVKGDAWRGLAEPLRIRQWYVPTRDGTTVRAKEAGLFWEVDGFFGDNAPLVTAEIELPDEKTVVELPDWIGCEVTDDHRYKNNNLAEHPFSEWCERKETK